MHNTQYCMGMNYELPWAESSWFAKIIGTFIPRPKIPLRTAISKRKILLPSKADGIVVQNPINDTARAIQ